MKDRCISIDSVPERRPPGASGRRLTLAMAALAVALLSPFFSPTRAGAVIIVRHPPRVLVPCVAARRTASVVVVRGPRWRWNHPCRGYWRHGVFVRVR